MSFLFQLYRIVVPKPIRTKILLNRLAKKIPLLHQSTPDFEQDEERKKVIDYIARKGVAIFPYDFTENYRQETIQVYTDDTNGLKYVLQEGRRLYFKRRWSERRIRKAYNDLCMEQDLESPHRYLAADFQLSENDVLADCGAAEGNFSLAIIEKVKKIYLFEYDPEWVEALRYTFEPYKNKVEIIPRYLSDRNDEKNCTGDVFFENRELSFLKIDVDGNERPLLNGFENKLSNTDAMKIALCTYHQQNDEEEFTQLFRSWGYQVKPSKGYMIFHYDKKMKAPYLRRAMVRAKK